MSIEEKLDNLLLSTAKTINYYTLLNPKNYSLEKKLFFSHLYSGQQYNPQFHYLLPDFSKERKQVQSIDITTIKNRLIRQLYENEIDPIINVINMYEAVGSGQRFNEINKKVFGEIDKGLSEKIIEYFAKLENRSLREKDNEIKKTYNDKEICSLLHNKLNSYGLLDWKVTIHKEMTATMAVATLEKNIRIRENTKFNDFFTKRILIHEVDAHILQDRNADLQPYKILRNMLAKEDPTEGLAIFLECLFFGKENSWKILHRSMGLAYSCLLAEQKSFYHTFCELRKYYSDEDAFEFSSRAKMGFVDTGQPGCCYKDVCYLRGYEKIKTLIKNTGKKKLRTLFVGKFHLDEIDTIEKLLKEGILKEPQYYPNFIDIVSQEDAHINSTK